MSNRIAELIAQLEPDTWRSTNGFSSDFDPAQQKLFHATSDEESVVEIEKWLQSKAQPCIFGRIAAKQGLLSHCVLRESDLSDSDEAIRNKIATARQEWTRDGFVGKKSGFIISLISPKIAYSKPGSTMKQLAQRVASLYLALDSDAKTDEILHDDLFLDIPGDDKKTIKWLAGINYFSAQGDKRWWHDHRLPGGMAFSINSVGHMVKSGKRQIAMSQLHETLEIQSDDPDNQNVTSLEQALNVAMLTIANASTAKSGKATALLPLPADRNTMPVSDCPYELKMPLKDKNFCNYTGYYHTDYTIPSEYFREDVERPADIPKHYLDFTYLFQRSIDNPAFETMGVGRRIRADGEESQQGAFAEDVEFKRLKGISDDVVEISSEPRLVLALRHQRTD